MFQRSNHSCLHSASTTAGSGAGRKPVRELEGVDPAQVVLAQLKGESFGSLGHWGLPLDSRQQQGTTCLDDVLEQLRKFRRTMLADVHELESGLRRHSEK